MCQQIIQFCNGSTKPLLFVGSFLLLLLAVAIGYTGCTANGLYQDIDPAVAQDKALAYYLQLAAALYLALITVSASLAAHFDHKHSIRALSVVTSVNFVLAAAAILLVATGPAVRLSFEDRLLRAQKLYNYTERFPQPANATNSSLIGTTGDDIRALPNRQARWAPAASGESAPDGAPDAATKLNPLKVSSELNQTEATRIWDRLQARGCCGFLNATTEWRPNGLPKSCCANPEENGENVKCKSVDLKHARPCVAVIESASLNLLIVLALIALVNLYLATVTGISAYRTFHYNEASQSAYT